MAFFLLTFGHVLSIAVSAGIYPTPNLQCTNDEERMFCQLEVKNCSGYDLNLWSDSGYGNKSCILQQVAELCRCDVEMYLVLGESHTAIVRKANTVLVNKTIGVIESFKPKTPTITSVKETNNKFEVNWLTNMEKKRVSLTAQMTYYKEGDTEKEWENVTTSICSSTAQQCSEIDGQHLEMSTTYVVRVRSVAELNGVISDSSNEWKFKTSASHNALFSGIITALCFGVIIISFAIYFCYVKLKTNWWDKLPNPEIPIVHPVKKMMLQPEKSWASPICIEQPKTDDSKLWSQMPYTDSECSGSEYNSTCSSHVSYADAPVDISARIEDNLSKIFPNISPVSHLQTGPFTSIGLSAPLSPHGVRYDGSTSGSSDLVNPSYSLLIPNPSNDILEDRPVVQTQTQLDCDFSYHSSKSDTMNIPAQDVSPFLPTDMHQPYNTDPQRFSHAEDPSLSSISSGINTTASCESSGNLSHPASTSSFPNKNPFRGCMLPESHSSVVLEDDYQPIQNLVAQPDVLFSEEQSIDQEGDLEKYQEKLFSKIPQSCLNPFFPGVSNDAPRGLSQHKLLTPSLFLMSADNCMPAYTESDYHSV